MRHAFLVLLVLASARASAQDAAPVRIALADAQARAVAASHRLAEARERLGAAQGVVAVRDAQDRPIVGLAAGYTRTNHVNEFFVPGPGGLPRVLYPDVPSNYATRVSLQWPIYSSGRTDALERAARAEASAVAADVDAAAADLRLEVARAFWALVTARAAAAVVDQAVARARAHLGDTRERYDAGLIPPNDVAAAEAQESRQRMLLIEARNQQAMSSAELARLIDADLQQPLQPDVDLVLTPPAAAQAEALVTEARAARNERRALTFRVDAADETVAAARRALRPTIGVTGGVDYARPNPRIFPRADRWDESWDAGINVAWSLWDGGRTRADVSQAASQAAAARRRLAEFDSVVALEVRQRLLEIDSGRASVTAAEDAVRAATEARRVVGERYQAGVITSTEVLDADVALLQAELDRTRALAGVRFAEARLARAIGR